LTELGKALFKVEIASAKKKYWKKGGKKSSGNINVH